MKFAFIAIALIAAVNSFKIQCHPEETKLA
jgi:hypothetical protein